MKVLSLIPGTKPNLIKLLTFDVGSIFQIFKHGAKTKVGNLNILI